MYHVMLIFNTGKTTEVLTVLVTLWQIEITVIFIIAVVTDLQRIIYSQHTFKIAVVRHAP